MRHIHVLFAAVALTAFVFLTTKTTERRRGFDSDGVVYARMVSLPPLTPSDVPAPWCQRVLTSEDWVIIYILQEAIRFFQPSFWPIFLHAAFSGLGLLPLLLLVQYRPWVRFLRQRPGVHRFFAAGCIRTSRRRRQVKTICLFAPLGRASLRCDHLVDQTGIEISVPSVGRCIPLWALVHRKLPDTDRHVQPLPGQIGSGICGGAGTCQA